MVIIYATRIRMTETVNSPSGEVNLYRGALDVGGMNYLV